jgi:hypothetical protein
MLRNIELNKVTTGRKYMKTAGVVRIEPVAVGAEMAFPSRTQQRGSYLLCHRTVIQSCFLAAAAVLLTGLISCTSEPSKPAETAKPEPKGPDLITARSAFQKLYVAARGWHQDAKPYRLESVSTSDGNGHDGKAAVWRASFGSAAMRSSKTYTWSGSAAEGAPDKGVNPSPEDSYSASNSTTQVFDMAFLKIDSDAAVATAQQHGGSKVLEKTPDTPVFFVCDWNHNTNQLVWHVIYGTNRDGARLTVAVNASTGEFIRVEK